MRVQTVVLAALTLTCGASVVKAAPLGTSFTYQGQLKSQGVPLTGTVDLEISLFDVDSGGNALDTTELDNVSVTNGLFNVELDFGAAAFNGDARWLEIAVRSPHDPGDTDVYTTLTPRQSMTATPYALQTRGLFVSDVGNVGIGTTSPTSNLEVNAGADGDAVIKLIADSANDNEADNPYLMFGQDGTNDLAFLGLSGNDSASVFDGRSIDDSLNNSLILYYRQNHAVQIGNNGGIAMTIDDGNVGIGTSDPLYPLHLETDGEFSIVSQNHSPAGFGLYGWATSSTGNTYGVYGESESTSGRGVYGFSSASTGVTDGVFGASVSSDGRGVVGLATANSGTSYGGYFESESTSGRGVYGFSSASTGFTYGGYFETNSTSSSTGVYGEATASTGVTYGGRFSSASTEGTGVDGWAPASSGVTHGVYGTSDSTAGRGVSGLTRAITGSTYGGYFECKSTTGTGVFGRSAATSGTTYGVQGSSASPDGFDFYASGTGTNYGSSSSRRWKNNIEPISDPLYKLSQLQGVYYDWDQEHGGQHDVGMIAEEVGKVLPEIVNYEENGVDAIGMDYSKMTPLLVEAVNAMRAEKDSQIESQQEQIAALRTELSEIKEGIRKMTLSSRASAFGMASPMLAAACLIGVVVMSRGRKRG